MKQINLWSITAVLSNKEAPSDQRGENQAFTVEKDTSFKKKRPFVKYEFEIVCR